MANWLRIGGYVLAGIVALWLAFQIVTIVLGVVAWLVRMAVTIAIAAAVLYVGYLLVSRVMNRQKSGPSRERERIYE